MPVECLRDRINFSISITGYMPNISDSPRSMPMLHLDRWRSYRIWQMWSDWYSEDSSLDSDFLHFSSYLVSLSLGLSGGHSGKIKKSFSNSTRVPLLYFSRFLIVGNGESQRDSWLSEESSVTIVHLISPRYHDQKREIYSHLWWFRSYSRVGSSYPWPDLANDHRHVSWWIHYMEDRRISLVLCS